jgi:hypothetical protein
MENKIITKHQSSRNFINSQVYLMIYKAGYTLETNLKIFHYICSKKIVVKLRHAEFYSKPFIIRRAAKYIFIDGQT